MKEAKLQGKLIFFRVQDDLFGVWGHLGWLAPQTCCEHEVLSCVIPEFKNSLLSLVRTTQCLWRHVEELRSGMRCSIHLYLHPLTVRRGGLIAAL